MMRCRTSVYMNDIDPITQQEFIDGDTSPCLNAICYNTTEGKNIGWYRFNAATLSKYILETGDIREPYTRRLFSTNELINLDQILGTPIRNGVWWFVETKQHDHKRAHLSHIKQSDDQLHELAYISLNQALRSMCNTIVHSFINYATHMIEDLQSTTEISLFIHALHHSITHRTGHLSILASSSQFPHGQNSNSKLKKELSRIIEGFCGDNMVEINTNCEPQGVNRKSRAAMKILLKSIVKGSIDATPLYMALQKIQNACEWHKPIQEIHADIQYILLNITVSWGVPISRSRLLETVTSRMCPD